MAVHETAVQLLAWIPGHQKVVSQFENKLVKLQKIRREMWTAYHGLCTSVAYRREWQTFLESIISSVTHLLPVRWQLCF